MHKKAKKYKDYQYKIWFSTRQSSLRKDYKLVMASIEERVESLIKKPIEDLGYTLYDVQYVKEGQNYFLRVFIEKPNGSIDLNDCEKVNDGINDILDTADYIKEQYFLEVSSTGLEKILRKDGHLKQNIGNEVQINLFKPINLESDLKCEEIVEKENIHKDLKNEKKADKKSKGKKSSNKNVVSKELVGNLKNFDEDYISLELENGEILQVDRKNISQIKTVFDWDSLE